MPITYRVDPDARLIRSEVKGDFTIADMLRTVSRAAAEVGGPGYNIVSDHRAIGEPATREQLEDLVDFLSRLRSVFGGARWAVVVSKPSSLGMMRMFSVFAQRVPIAVRVFQDPAAAEAWARSGDAEARAGIST